jgi:hypothetical protein
VHSKASAPHLGANAWLTGCSQSIRRVQIAVLATESMSADADAPTKPVECCMTPTRSRQSASGTCCQSPRSQATVAALIVAVIGLLMASAGCAEPLVPLRLPLRTIGTPTATSTPPETPASSVMTPRQQVLAALAGYMTAVGQAEDSRSGAVARDLLRPYLAPERIDGLVRAMMTIWARGDSFDGQDVRHVSNVTVYKGHAFVHDCDDTSRMALVDIATGQTVAGSFGTLRANLVTRLDLVGGHWLVEFQIVDDVPCSP